MTLLGEQAQAAAADKKVSAYRALGCFTANSEP